MSEFFFSTRDWNGLLPIFILCWVTIQQIVCDTAGQGRATGAHEKTSSPATWPHDTVGPRARVSGSARAQPG